jgi:hypothetical protein
MQTELWRRVEMKASRTLRWIVWTGLMGFVVSNLTAQAVGTNSDPLKYFFDGKRGQVEVGGPYVGVEFHHSRPVPSRISFYYPVANSIDLSTDYWKRGESLPMAVGLKVGNAAPEWIQHESWSYVLSPNKVTFLKTTDSVAWAITYEFCLHQPAAVVSIQLKNRLASPLPVELYTHLLMSLRTCQTYARKDTSLMSYDPGTGTVVARFNERETDSASVFVQNVGESPVEWTTYAQEVMATDAGGSQWPNDGKQLSNPIFAQPVQERGIAAFVYRKVLQPGESMSIVQVVGSCKEKEVYNIIASLSTNWPREVLAYDEFIRTKAEGEAYFRTGDRVLDRSAIWARALIAANAHYLDGKIVPMPCPAEYNFFFTHDLLLTSLGAVDFDLERVKSNLLYVVSMAKDSVIPHAYYWRDDGFKTEYCEPENWNHLWFVIASGSYLRHSLDDSTGRMLYPYLSKSVHELLTRLRPDGLMYAYRPDWWDIGHIEGPRAYLTALAVRALREYLFISSFLHEKNDELQHLDETANLMQRALVNRLWNKSDQYLMNYNGGEEDHHFYAGTLIASVYGLLDQAHARSLVATATKQLVDEQIGIRVAMPPDFSTQAIIKKFKLAGDEAGPAYAYINGGVWPHGNAWYAMSLKDIGKLDEAYDFTKRTMTIDGIAHSPNGLPAMYEYRNSNPNSTAFGTIDKPSFLWAGGMYLQVLYRLFAVDENEWNLGIRSQLPSESYSVSCTLTFGGTSQLLIHRSSNAAGALKADGRLVPSRILPLDLRSTRHWESSGVDSSEPFLTAANAILYDAHYDSATKRLSCDVSSFDGHTTVLKVESKLSLKRFTVDGKLQAQKPAVSAHGRTNESTIVFPGSARKQRIVLEF